jgi:hypothetical protein
MVYSSRYRTPPVYSPRHMVYSSRYRTPPVYSPRYMVYSSRYRTPPVYSPRYMVYSSRYRTSPVYSPRYSRATAPWERPARTRALPSDIRLRRAAHARTSESSTHAWLGYPSHASVAAHPSRPSMAEDCLVYSLLPSLRPLSLCFFSLSLLTCPLCSPLPLSGGESPPLQAQPRVGLNTSPCDSD